MSVCYELIFKGEVHPSINIETAKMRLSFVYKTSPAALDHLFSGEAFILKTFHEESEMDLYFNGLNKLGLIVEKNIFDPDAPNEISTDSETEDATPHHVYPEDHSNYSVTFSGQIGEDISLNEAKSVLQEYLQIGSAEVTSYFNGQTHILADNLNNEKAATFIVNHLMEKGIFTAISKQETISQTQEQLDENLSDNTTELQEISETLNIQSEQVDENFPENTESSQYFSETPNIQLNDTAIPADQPLFKIVFLGKCLEGFTKNNVIPQMATIFNVQIEQIEPLFNEQAHIIKSNLNIADANNFVLTLSNLGLLVEIQAQ